MKMFLLTINIYTVKKENSSIVSDAMMCLLPVGPAILYRLILFRWSGKTERLASHARFYIFVASRLVQSMVLYIRLTRYGMEGLKIFEKINLKFDK